MLNIKDFGKNPNIPRDSFLSKIIYGNEELHENFQKFLIQNKFTSSHMTTIARKSKFMSLLKKCNLLY